MTGKFEMEGKADFVQAGPTLQFLTSEITFKTQLPAATCNGRIWLLPVRCERPGQDDETCTWKIWILSTKLDNLDAYPEDQTLLQSAGRLPVGLKTFETDVSIVGGGNAAAALAARLKALGVYSIMADRNPKVGDNWALRYDCMKFHIPTSFCQLPYLDYPEKPKDQLLSREDLSTQLKHYVQTFNLDVISSVDITRTTQDEKGRWHVGFETPDGEFTAIAKYLVQATGFGSQIPNLPAMEQRQAFNGISLHSSQYKNARKLKDQGVKSVSIIGSANTAFDVLEDCHAAGLDTTMIVRSPTYLVPLEYICHESSLGAYDNGVEAADKLFMMLPTIVDSQLGQGLFAAMASQEPGRYSALRETGFPVIDSRDPQAALMHNLVERGGGHYVDTGATTLITEGKVNVRAGVEPKRYTTKGLQLSDDSTLDTDAVIWCTGFADKDARQTVSDILKIPLPVDATWGVNKEGEIRGMWKRHSKVNNFLVVGGYTSQHRWFSKVAAQQIVAELAGLLPPPYL